ncbi:transcription factor [Schizosaccharomyces japonicus yFS275]|uniref:Transcription factor n=1 Tax=Schizosaccharomyces japonicus (strain yFS275 / FY16936) TaxID=402676 RepID=B6K6T2_SCHJY|nr:transcription factor [Schizosaccharomyces japonicus yFS275]EEB09236.1 transcription factor [Schizosaccharomyces japonicus yFS275]
MEKSCLSNPVDLLNFYIYDYFVKNKFEGAAKAFLDEAKVQLQNGQDNGVKKPETLEDSLQISKVEAKHNPTDSYPNETNAGNSVNANTDNISVSRRPIDIPGGFLIEWWDFFWDVFSSRVSPTTSAGLASMAASQQRQAVWTRNQQAAVPQFAPTAPPQSQLARSQLPDSVDASNAMNRVQANKQAPVRQETGNAAYEAAAKGMQERKPATAVPSDRPVMYQQQQNQSPSSQTIPPSISSNSTGLNPETHPHPYSATISVPGQQASVFPPTPAQIQQMRLNQHYLQQQQQQQQLRQMRQHPQLQQRYYHLQPQMAAYPRVGQPNPYSNPALINNTPAEHGHMPVSAKVPIQPMNAIPNELQRQQLAQKAVSAQKMPRQMGPHPTMPVSDQLPNRAMPSTNPAMAGMNEAAAVPAAGTQPNVRPQGAPISDVEKVSVKSQFSSGTISTAQLPANSASFNASNYANQIRKAQQILLRAGINPIGLTPQQLLNFYHHWMSMNAQRGQPPSHAGGRMPMPQDASQNPMLMNMYGNGNVFPENMPQQVPGNPALNDYHMQLLALEEQSKRRLMMARQEQERTTSPQDAVNDNFANGPKARVSASPKPPLQKRPGADQVPQNKQPLAQQQQQQMAAMAQKKFVPNQPEKGNLNGQPYPNMQQNMARGYGQAPYANGTFPDFANPYANNAMTPEVLNQAAMRGMIPGAQNNWAAAQHMRTQQYQARKASASPIQRPQMSPNMHMKGATQSPASVTAPSPQLRSTMQSSPANGMTNTTNGVAPNNINRISSDMPSATNFPTAPLPQDVTNSEATASLGANDLNNVTTGTMNAGDMNLRMSKSGMPVSDPSSVTAAKSAVAGYGNNNPNAMSGLAQGNGSKMMNQDNNLFGFTSKNDSDLSMMNDFDFDSFLNDTATDGAQLYLQDAMGNHDGLAGNDKSVMGLSDSGLEAAK